LPELRVVADAAPSVEGLARYDTEVKWHVEAKLGESWQKVPGTDGSAPVRLYGVLGNALGATPPSMPWVQVVDEVAQAVKGQSTDPMEVRDLIVQHIYERSGLRYETNQGTSMYTTYSSGTYVNARFDLSAYLKRSKGSAINCSDCASILSTYASMVGAKLDYCILVLDFPLNPILGLGASMFGSPFRSGNMAFKYHAVTSHDSGATVFDATLAVDGDADPKSAPQTKKLVQHQPSSEYLMRLSPGTPRYQHVDQKTLLR
jgi:hypothetical protein